MDEEYNSDQRFRALRDINASMDVPDDLGRLLQLWADGEMTLKEIFVALKEDYKIREIPGAENE